MALYTYTKAKPANHVKKRGKKSGKMISLLLMTAGVVVLVWVAYPVVSFGIISHIKYESSLSQIEKVKNALSSMFNKRTSLTRAVVKTNTSNVLATETTDSQSTEIDYTKISNWFPKKPQNQIDSSGRIYFLSIPKLKIKDAMVKIAGEDLNKSLIHYGGTGLPGEYGTAVIFGHSILPAFYNPDNYKTIFSYLPKLDNGDEIFVKYDGITYRYIVSEMRVTSPEDISVLEQRYDNSYLSLITCVPPGTYWKRLLVRARLSPS